MIGGASFERSQFNRATQALRQVGSLFKPFVYTAAIDRGYTALSELDDSPASFPAGPNQPPYEPKNYDHEYHGMVTVREALQGSRNVPTIRLMAALGANEVILYARKLGVTSPIPPYLSVAIGAAEGTLLEMTSAYSAYPNQGVRMTPQLLIDVTDREGNMLEQHRPQPHVVRSKFVGNRCDPTGPDLGGGAVRALSQHDGRPVTVVGSTLTKGVCSNGSALSSIGVSWSIYNSVFTATARSAWRDPSRPDTPGGGSGGAATRTATTSGSAGPHHHDPQPRARGRWRGFFVSNDRSGVLEIRSSTCGRTRVTASRPTRGSSSSAASSSSSTPS